MDKLKEETYKLRSKYRKKHKQCRFCEHTSPIKLNAYTLCEIKDITFFEGKLRAKFCKYYKAKGGQDD